jgi:integrase
MFKFKKGKGSYVIDRRYGDVGRIRRASGTTHKATLKSILEMLKQFYDTGRHDILREIQAGIVRPIDVYHYYKDGKLKYLPSAATLQMVDPVVVKFFKTHYKLETTRRGYIQSFEKFLRVVGNHRVQRLPEKVKEYRRHCEEKELEHTFNHLRKGVSAFLRQTFGRSSVLWQSVSEIEKLQYTEATKQPLSVPEFNLLITKLPTEYADVARTMAYTGMHWREITDKWEIRGDRVWILGAKKRGKGKKRRTREVPLIDPDANLKRPTFHEQTFRKHLKRAGRQISRPDVSPMTFRHTYEHWLEQTPLVRSHTLYYMGHVGEDTIDRYYGPHEMTRFINEDAESIKEYLDEKSKPPTPKVQVAFKPGYDIIEPS